MAEESKYIQKKKSKKLGRPLGGTQPSDKNQPEDVLDKISDTMTMNDIVIMVPKKDLTKGVERDSKRSGGRVCKLATKGKGRAYGKNS